MGAFELAVSTPWALSNWRFLLYGRFRIGGFYSMGAFELAVCTPWALSLAILLHGRFRIVRGRVQIGDIGAEGVDCEGGFK